MDQEAYRLASLSRPCPSPTDPRQGFALAVLPTQKLDGACNRQMYTPSAELNKEQDVQRLQAYRFYSEEVAGEHLVGIMTEKRAPPSALTLRCGEGGTCWRLSTFLMLERLTE